MNGEKKNIKEQNFTPPRPLQSPHSSPLRFRHLDPHHRRAAVCPCRQEPHSASDRRRLSFSFLRRYHCSFLLSVARVVPDGQCRKIHAVRVWKMRRHKRSTRGMSGVYAMLHHVPPLADGARMRLRVSHVEPLKEGESRPSVELASISLEKSMHGQDEQEFPLNVRVQRKCTVQGLGYQEQTECRIFRKHGNKGKHKPPPMPIQ